MNCEARNSRSLVFVVDVRPTEDRSLFAQERNTTQPHYPRGWGSMTAELEAFRSKFRVEELTIYRSIHWTWSTRPVHSTLGAGILSLNRFSPSFADLSEAEGADLTLMVRRIESTLALFSAPDKMNYVMLMMVDPHLHFHVLPRYSSHKVFAGFEWVDAGWPALPAMGDYAARQDSPALLQIRDALRDQQI